MSTICTLFEGNYHYGLAALVNSLYARGYRGQIFAGYRGEPPPWAGPHLRANGAGSLFDVAADCHIHFLPLETKLHLNNYKPHFLLEVMQKHCPDEQVFFFFDPDIIVRGRWSFFEEWVNHGIAICEDINHNMPRSHPVRLAWKKYALQHGLEVRQELDKFYNGGFFGIRREHAGFLEIWKHLFDLRAADGIDLSQFELSAFEYPYIYLDQDLMNLAMMLMPFPITAVGPEGMDFQPGGYVMSHSAGDNKSWRKNFIRDALTGRAPSRTDKQFLQFTQQPIRIYSRRTLLAKQVSATVGSAIGRFYRRH